MEPFNRLSYVLQSIYKSYINIKSALSINWLKFRKLLYILLHDFSNYSVLSI